jgi:sterol desaturase/sphingolipid hydroxylase (fatty acid hydroxylase superfamily)
MKAISLNKSTQISQQLKCFAVFVLILTPIMYCAIRFADRLSYAVTPLLFFTGWFIWTFAEYVMHRFWNHAKNAENSSIVQRHNHHHTHPTEISISGKLRAMMLCISLVLIALSLWLNTYLMFIAGMWTGFFWFFLMHYFLHQKWAKKVFPRLVHYHVVHHCKEPDTCFGISVAWWDILFSTTPKKNKKISERILSFYYRREQKPKPGYLISSIVDEKLSHR